MFKYGNFKTLFKLSSKIYSKNRMRNIFLTLALILCTSLTVITFLVGSNAVSTVNYYEGKDYIEGMATGEVNDYILENNSNKNKYEIVSNISFTKIVEKSTTTLQETTVYRGDKLRLKYMSHPEHFKNEDVTLALGEYPKSNSEVLLSEEIYTSLGDIRIGEEVKITREILRGDGSNFVSTESFKVVGVVQLNSSDEVIYAGNMNGILNLKTVMLTVILVIVITSYLILYNILYIHVLSYSSEYEILRIIGVKGTDVGKIIFMQVVKSAIIAIPLGIVFGTFISKLIGGRIIQLTGYTLIGELQLSIWPYIYSFILTLIIMKISCYMPTEYVKNINLYKNEFIEGFDTIKISHKRTSIVKIMDIAIKNVYSNKKKIFLAIVSMIFSSVIIIFLVNTTFAIDINNSLENIVEGDFSIQAYEDNSFIDLNILEEIEKIHGIEIEKKYDEDFSQEINGNNLREINIYIKENFNEKDIRNQLENLNIENLKLVERNLIVEDVYKIQKGLFTIGLILSALVGFISILNLFNSTLTSLLSRKGALSVLRAIGLKKNELVKLIIYEGLYTFFLASLPVIILGTLFASYIMLSLPYYLVITSSRIVISLGIALVMLLIVNIAVPYISYLCIFRNNIFNRLSQDISY